MKNGLLLLLSFTLSVIGYSQNSKYALPERQTPVFKKEKTTNAQYLNDLSPTLWANMGMPQGERYFLDHRRVNEYPQPVGYQYPQEKYKEVIEVVFLEIKTTCNGKLLSAQSKSDKLTDEQKNILTTADLGARVQVNIKFKYKDQGADNFGPRNNTIEGALTLTVVPETEAEFPGGHKQLSDYFIGSVINKASDKKATEKIQRAEVVFTVTEDGNVTGAKLSRTTTDTNLDKLLLDAVSKMPKWKPAVNNKGEKVKQEFIIPFSVGC